MTPRRPRYSMEEHVRRGKEIYHNTILPKVEAANKGKYVAIDIETEDFEIAKDPSVATDRLLERLPDAQIWCERIGYPYVVRFGHLRPEAIK